VRLGLGRTVAVSDSWEERLFGVLDDLEQQADAAFAFERSLEVEDRARAEYASVGWGSRLMASLDRDVRLELLGAVRVSGRLVRVSAGWCLVEGAHDAWLVPWEAVLSAYGLAERATPREAWPAVAGLGLGSALRRLAEADEPCRLRLRDGSVHDVRLGRVGADFLEAYAGDAASPGLHPFAALAAVQSRRDVLEA
jgi:hypothetical protein